ncbi:hypothetical protein TNCT_173851 [Trichonephila clavata]|uniref:Uncharacterized protein n=1 Tax=Trichonephila clavata TaxID=2740835 RepID=A0A8X6I825_TRICU|nr:hypothetical protein TNCT_173851 [Trichonephila clavata]
MAGMRMQLGQMFNPGNAGYFVPTMPQNVRGYFPQAGNTNPSHLTLHTALYTLQQQQIIQLHQVIQQLQSQLVGSTSSATNH